MTLRKPLKKRMENAWRKCIEEDYNSRRINSERSLQAAFWFRLNQMLNSKGKAARQIFIEPHFLINGKPFYPDLVVCNSRRVIGVIELKYQPRTKPKFEKDFGTMQNLSENRAVLKISNERYLGPDVSAHEYRFSKDVVFVWAGVYRNGNEKPRPVARADHSLGAYLMELHAVAEQGRKAAVYRFDGLAD